MSPARLPTIVPDQLEARFAVRLQCLRMATDMCINDACGGNWSLESVKKFSKDLETHVWGGFGPIEAPPTPLSTIEEATSAAKAILWELLNNTADPEKQISLRTALATWERFTSELHAAIGEGK